LQQVTTNGNTSNVGISVTAGGISTNSLTDTGLTLGSVAFAGTGGLISQDNANLFWDDTNNRLGINTNTPGNSLDVHTAGTNPTIAVNNTAGSQSAISFLNTSVAKWRIGNTATNTFDIYNFGLSLTTLSINNATNIVSFTESIKISQTSSFQATAGYNSIIGTANGFGFQLGISTISPTFAFNSLTASRNYIFPDAAGTLALTSNLSSYLPLAGGTLTGTLNGTNANFTGNLGVGTITPSTALEISCGSTNGLKINATDIPSLFFYVQGGSQKNWGIATTNLVLGDFGIYQSNSNGGNPINAGTPKIYIPASGNILINKTVDNTVNKLQVAGSALIYDTINLNSSITTNVSTVATTISTVANTYGGLAIVWGSSAGQVFTDLVFYSLNTTFVINGQSVSGAPSARVYTCVSGNLKLAMALGTYTIYYHALLTE
jgi:hypothetical protein